jgi:hypothetical protein
MLIRFSFGNFHTLQQPLVFVAMRSEELSVIVEAWREATSQILQEGLRRTNRLISFDSTRTA